MKYEIQIYEIKIFVNLSPLYFRQIKCHADNQYHLSLFGTGSQCSCVDHGWHLKIRFSPIQPPLTMPHSMTASIIYCEQVGEYRHLLGPKSGEIKSR